MSGPASPCDRRRQRKCEACNVNRYFWASGDRSQRSDRGDYHGGQEFSVSCQYQRPQCRGDCSFDQSLADASARHALYPAGIASRAAGVVSGRSSGDISQARIIRSSPKPIKAGKNLNRNLEVAGIRRDGKTPLFRSAAGKTGRLAGRCQSGCGCLFFLIRSSPAGIGETLPDLALCEIRYVCLHASPFVGGTLP